jgi:hypothetical protein
MAVQLGQTGSATYATINIPNLRNIRYSAKRGNIDVTVKGDTSFQIKPGFVTRTISFDALLDYVTGQQDIIDFLETATPDVTVGTLVLTIGPTKTFTFTNGALYLGHEITSPPGEAPVTVSFDFALQVYAAISWA